MPAYLVRCAIRSTHKANGSLIVTVLNYEADVLTDPPNLTGIATDVWTHLGTEYLAMLSTNEQCHDITATTWDVPNVPPAQGVHNVELQGTRTLGNNNLSPGLCALLSWKTATPKRYARGHTFAPPCWDGMAVTGEGMFLVGSPYLTAVGNFGAKYLQPFTVSSTGYQPVIVSDTRLDANTPPWSFPITSWTSDQKQHFLRKRITVP